MTDRKSNLLVTMVFDENSQIGKQVEIELALKNQIIKYLLHLIKCKEIKHFVVGDDVVINEKLTQEHKVGKWKRYEKEFTESGTYRQIKMPVIECSICQEEIAGHIGIMKYCPNCGAEMKGEEWY